MKRDFDLFYPLLFLYFFTLHADQLNWVWGGYTIRLNNLVAVALLVCVALRMREEVFAVHKRLAIPLLLIGLSMLISFMLSPYKSRCGFYLGWYGITLLCYVLLPYLIVKWWDAKKVFSLYQVSFVCVGLYAATQLAMSVVGIEDPFASQKLFGDIVRPNAFCFEPSFYALYMTPFVFWVNARFLIDDKYSFWHVLGVNALYLISASAAVIFAYAFFFLFSFLVPGSQRKKALYFFLIFTGILTFFVLAFPLILKFFFLKFFYQGFMAHHSFYERWLGVENGWKLFLKHPISGVGFGAFPSYLMEAYLQGDTGFNFMGTETLGEVLNPLKAFEAMNVFTELLASLGIIGLVAFSTLIIGFLRQAKSAFAHDPHAVYICLTSVLTAFFVVQFNQGLLRTYMWVHLALAFAYLEQLILVKAPHGKTGSLDPIARV